MAKLLVILERESDLSRVLAFSEDTAVLTFEQAKDADLAAFDCFAVLGGTCEKGKVLDVRLREKLEAETDKGKKVFAEFLCSFRYVYSDLPSPTTHHRLAAAEKLLSLDVGDVLDDENNAYMKPYFQMPETRVLLYYHDYIVAHSKTDMTEEEIRSGNMALWLAGENVLMCGFRLCDFCRARMAPYEKWKAVIAYILEFLGCSCTEAIPERSYQNRFREEITDANLDALLDETVKKGIAFLQQFVLEKGAYGIEEGLSHHIRPDGTQLRARGVRTDCVGESAGAFWLYGKKTKQPELQKLARTMEQLVYGPMLVKGGTFDGMLRWSETAWGVCYQDDVARAVLPMMYRNLLEGTRERMEEVCHICDFLISTTAQNGTRRFRTDCVEFGTEYTFDSLKNDPDGYPCAHYNAYYCALLLMAYLLTKRETYRDVAVKGMEAMMARYPDTIREQSETEELCRLVLPLALLYQVTGEEAHKKMLYRVTEDLEAHRYPCGGYGEWDTGYKANFNRESKSECSLLANNGDPVADLLYAVNWLPLGFAFAYYATKDSLFYDRWKNIAVFFIRSQMQYPGNIIDGAWCRAFDLETGEVCGVPHDIGWGPNAVETGWTVSEILMGLMIMEYLK